MNFECNHGAKSREVCGECTNFVVHDGYDRFLPDAGKERSMYCSICGDKMNAERNLYGATSRGAAAVGIKREYDEFTCPNSGTPWHEQVYRLLREADATASKLIEDMLKSEIHSLLWTRKATK